MTNSALQKELEFFKTNQDFLVSQHAGKFLVLKDQKVEGAYEFEIEAYSEAQKQFELGTFLIQHCLPGTDTYTQTFHSRVVVG